MKKSEKIEIRISHEEKEKLNRLAESEGRSVSELVRDLARKYALLNTSQARPRRSLRAGAGLLLCGLGGGIVFALALFGRSPLALNGSHYMVHGIVENHGFGFRLW